MATAVGIHDQYLYQCLTGRRPTPVDRCPAIERATSGRVSCEELRPDVRWHRVPDADWPHPEGRPLIDVAAPKAHKEAA
ncbi:YdaS family helix-turn-helix protein [Aquariibacter albus]|uniref:YdaS family helix-turn-helix protein n=1 Tax=Aquariibacter albus TaxID=2759899 RepID=UPI001C71C895|nr:YdaS family helix-turn-helix protein [Aquariibacter albus]